MYLLKKINSTNNPVWVPEFKRLGLLHTVVDHKLRLLEYNTNNTGLERLAFNQ